MARPKKRKDTRGKRGQGSVYQRKDGLWAASLTVNGARIVRYASSEDNADRILLDLRRDAANGALLTQSNQTVSDYLAGWLSTVVQPRVRPNTYAHYEMLCRVYLIPSLGKHKLTSLTPAHVQAMLAAMTRAGKSASLQRQTRLILSIALNRAVKWEMVTRNVAHLVDAPRVEEPERPLLTGEELTRFFTIAEGHRYGTIYIVGATSGLRIGEVLGLTWDRIDLERGVLTVNRQMTYRIGEGLVFGPVKQSASNRTVPIPLFVLPILRRHKARQNEDRLAAGQWWQDTAGLVFTGDVGQPLWASETGKALKLILADANLPDITLHSLRRSYASLLANLGAMPATVQALLGHANPEITLGIYTKASEAAKREAANLLDRYFGG